MKLQGNIYELQNGWFMGYVWNILNGGSALSLQGHYMVLFKDKNTFRAYKHGDFASSAVLTSYNELEFNGFETLNNADEEFIKDIISGTMPIMQKYPYKEGRKILGTIKVFKHEADPYNMSEYDIKIQKIMDAINLTAKSN